MRRTSLLAAGITAAALLVPASPASAAPFCNTTTGGTFDGTTVCVETYSVLPLPYLSIPYSVGPVCVWGTCTPPLYGTIDVPLVRDPVDVYGTLCVTVSRNKICRPFTDDIYIGDLGR